MAANCLLSDVKVRNAKPEVRAARGSRGKALDTPTPEQLQIAPRLTKFSDGGGLTLWVMPDGSKSWRFSYRFAGLQKSLSIGSYPAISLREAREGSDSARKMLARGVDPAAHKRVQRAALAASRVNTFEAVAAELLKKKRDEKKAPRTLEKIEWLFGLILPTLGPRPIAELEAPEILTVLRQIEKRGRFDTAHRLRALIGEVFRRAVADGRAKIDPTPDLRDQLTTPTRTPHPAITKPDEFGGLLRAIDGYRRGAPETRLALQLLALTFVRPDELRWARWDEFDLGGAEATWTLPAERMKMRREHKVPLSRQAVEIVRELRALSRGGAFLFPGRTTARPMSESCLSAALHYMGIPKDVHCPHGFRSSFSSIANAARTPAKDADGRPLIPRRMWDSDAIELQSSRVNGGAVRRVYCREDFMAERREMMQWWANYLDTLRADVKMKEVA